MDPSSVIQALQAQIATSRKAWQRQIWELEGQLRDLRAEMEEMRAREATATFPGAGEVCAFCGHKGRNASGDMYMQGAVGLDSDKDSGSPIVPARKASLPEPARMTGVVNRPRARTGVGSHFGAAS
jgi:hypothetical protein